MVVKFPADLAPAATASIAEDGCASDDGVFFHLDKKEDGTSSAKATLGRDFAEVAKKNVLEKAVLHFW